MELVTFGIALAVGAASGWIADLLKAYFRSRKEATDVEVIGPTGQKMRLSAADAQNVDLTAIKKKMLRDMLLNPKFKFGREFDTLKSAIGSNDEETKSLLLQLGARHNLLPGGKDTWTLHSEDKVPAH